MKVLGFRVWDSRPWASDLGSGCSVAYAAGDEVS